MRPRVLALVVTLCAGAIVAGCGGDGLTTPTEPATITLTLDFLDIKVEEDCDGIEGDGDFEFRLQTYESPAATREEIYHKSLSLGPGGTSGWIGRRSYTFPATADAQRTVWFGASEMDQDILGLTYPDKRLSNAGGAVGYSYTNGTWNTLGDRSITLGTDGCRVTLRWTATADVS